MPLRPAGREGSGFKGEFARSAEFSDSSQAETRKRTDASSCVDSDEVGDRPRPPKSLERMLRVYTSCKVSASRGLPDEERIAERD